MPFRSGLQENITAFFMAGPLMPRDLARACITDDTTVRHHNGTLGIRSDILLMCHHNDGASLLVKSLQNVHDFSRCSGIEISRRFIGENDHRVSDKRSCNGNPLLLTTRKLVRGMVFTLLQANLAQLHQGFLATISRFTAVDMGEAYIVEEVHPFEKMKLLKYKSGCRIAQGRKFVISQIIDACAQKSVFTAVRLVQHAQNMHERRLSGTGCAHNCDKLSFVNAERNTPERLDRSVTNTVGFANIA